MVFRERSEAVRARLAMLIVTHGDASEPSTSPGRVMARTVQNNDPILDRMIYYIDDIPRYGRVELSFGFWTDEGKCCCASRNGGISRRHTRARVGSRSSYRDRGVES